MKGTNYAHLTLHFKFIVLFVKRKERKKEKIATNRMHAVNFLKISIDRTVFTSIFIQKLLHTDITLYICFPVYDAQESNKIGERKVLPIL